MSRRVLALKKKLGVQVQKENVEEALAHGAAVGHTAAPATGEVNEVCT